MRSCFWMPLMMCLSSGIRRPDECIRWRSPAVWSRESRWSGNGLAFLKKQADYIIDTSQLLTRELKQELDKIFVQNREFKNLMITVLSFGFKYGIPADADLVFDVRFLPNPYYYENLRKLTGNDKEIQDFVMGYDMAHIFLDKLEDMIRFLVPNYVLEGKNQLVIAIGCTGGKHRSVTWPINYMSVCQSRQDYGVKLEHRDIGKDAARGK